MNPNTGGLPNSQTGVTATASSVSQALPIASPQYAAMPGMPPAQPIQPGSTTGPVLDQTIAEANKIISQTQQSPYNQALALEKLKVDYIRKQFGRSIKAPEQ